MNFAEELELSTIVSMVEGNLNSRRIIYFYSVADEPLTLSHFVIGRRLASVHDSDHFSDLEGTDAAIERRVKNLSQLLQHFCQRWSKEYLLDLREFHKCAAKGRVII